MHFAPLWNPNKNKEKSLGALNAFTAIVGLGIQSILSKENWVKFYLYIEPNWEVIFSPWDSVQHCTKLMEMLAPVQSRRPTDGIREEILGRAPFSW